MRELAKMYTPIKLNISPDQHEKLKDAVKHKKSVSLKVTINGKKGRHLFLLTRSQRKRLERAKLINKSTVKIKLGKKQVIANVEHRGGFLGALLGLASRFLPTWFHGVCGDGLFVKQGSQIYDGRGLLLGKNSPFKNIPILGLLL